MPEYEVNLNHIDDVQQQVDADSVGWFGEELTKNLPYLALCIGGEAGEFQNKVKKVVRGDVVLDADYRDVLIDELIDVFIYTCEIANLLGVHLGVAYNLKREINVQRFGTQPGGDLRVVDGVADGV